MSQRGLVTKIFDWIAHPLNTGGNTSDYVGGLALILIAAFLWSTVVKQIVSEV